jgi:hypothetical protein
MPDTKRLIIAVAGSEKGQEFHDVAILPNTRAIDVLRQLNLNGFQLAKPEGGFFAANDDIYSAVADGQKLFVAKSDVQAG